MPDGRRHVRDGGPAQLDRRLLQDLCPPAGLPWPYTLAKGENLGQGSLASPALAQQRPPRRQLAVTVTVGERAVATHVGLGLAALPITRRALGHAGALAVGPASSWSSSTPARATTPASSRPMVSWPRALDAELVLEVVLLRRRRRQADRRSSRCLAVTCAVQGQMERVGFGQRGSRSHPPATSSHPARQRLAPGPGLGRADRRGAGAFPGFPVGGGMFSYFTELNRKRPPAGLFDFVATPSTARACRRRPLADRRPRGAALHLRGPAFAGGTPYWLFPTAIAMRHNPYGAAPAENPRRPGRHGAHRPARPRADRRRLVCRSPRACGPRRPLPRRRSPRSQALRRRGRRRPALPGRRARGYAGLRNRPVPASRSASGASRGPGRRRRGLLASRPAGRSRSVSAGARRSRPARR